MREVKEWYSDNEGGQRKEEDIWSHILDDTKISWKPHSIQIFPTIQSLKGNARIETDEFPTSANSTFGPHTSETAPDLPPAELSSVSCCAIATVMGGFWVNHFELEFHAWGCYTRLFQQQGLPPQNDKLKGFSCWFKVPLECPSSFIGMKRTSNYGIHNGNFTIWFKPLWCWVWSYAGKTFPILTLNSLINSDLSCCLHGAKTQQSFQDLFLQLTLSQHSC